MTMRLSPWSTSARTGSFSRVARRHKEYGLLRTTYTGKLVDEQLAALNDRFEEEVPA